LFASATAEPETVFQETVFDVRYSADSVRFSGILCEPYVEPGTLKEGFEIVKDFPIGYAIYDDGNTPFIEGVRVNGEFVESLKVFYTEDVSTYTVEVKVVYADGILGDLASISDGTYDWAKLLENPIILLQGIYFTLAILSVVVGIVTAFVGRRKKIKTADEIARKVEEASETAIVNVEKRVTESVIAEVIPIVQKLFDSMQNVVKAITLSTSKSKEAPIALLDTLKESANDSTKELIDQIQKVLKDALEKEAATHEANVKTLHEISTPKPVAPVSKENIDAPLKSTGTKSLF
jgi:hypothetical protein